MTGSISGVTNYAQLLDTQRSLSRQQTELSFLQKELSTGRKRDGLIGVAFESLQKQGLGSDTIRAQQYRQTSVQANIYLRAIDATQYRTDLYNQSILNLQNIVNDMNAELLKAQTTVPSVYTVQQGLVNSALSRVESILNTTDGQRFVFAGNAYATKPVKTLNALDNAALVAGVNGFAAATNSPPRNATYANAVQTVPFTAPVNTAQFAGDGNTNVPGYVVTSLDSAAPSTSSTWSRIQAWMAGSSRCVSRPGGSAHSLAKSWLQPRIAPCRSVTRMPSAVDSSVARSSATSFSSSFSTSRCALWSRSATT